MTVIATPLDIGVLIEQLRAATKPDGDLDATIALITGWRYVQWSQMPGEHWYPPGSAVAAKLPPFTSSIDAALTLIPSEPRNEPSGTYDWQLESTNGGLTISARVGPEDTRSFAETPTLALCIAALKARSAT